MRAQCPNGRTRLAAIHLVICTPLKEVAMTHSHSHKVFFRTIGLSTLLAGIIIVIAFVTPGDIAPARSHLPTISQKGPSRQVAAPIQATTQPTATSGKPSKFTRGLWNEFNKDSHAMV